MFLAIKPELFFFLFADDSDHYYESLDTAGLFTTSNKMNNNRDASKTSGATGASSDDPGEHNDIDYDSFDSEDETDEDVKKVLIGTTQIKKTLYKKYYYLIFPKYIFKK